MDQPSKAQPRVVIVGAGFGGLEAAKALRHIPVELIIVDRLMPAPEMVLVVGSGTV